MLRSCVRLCPSTFASTRRRSCRTTFCTTGSTGPRRRPTMRWSGGTSSRNVRKSRSMRASSCACCTSRICTSTGGTWSAAKATAPLARRATAATRSVPTRTCGPRRSRTAWCRAQIFLRPRTTGATIRAMRHGRSSAARTRPSGMWAGRTATTWACVRATWSCMTTCSAILMTSSSTAHAVSLTVWPRSSAGMCRSLPRWAITTRRRKTFTRRMRCRSIRARSSIGTRTLWRGYGVRMAGLMRRAKSRRARTMHAFL